MVKREIRKAPTFGKNLKTLEKKHRNISAAVEEYFECCITEGPPPTSSKIPRNDGKPVYKDRIPLPGSGKRGGARVIFYCDEKIVAPLYCYQKSDQENISSSKIEIALDVLTEDE